MITTLYIGSGVFLYVFVGWVLATLNVAYDDLAKSEHKHFYCPMIFFWPFFLLVFIGYTICMWFKHFCKALFALSEKVSKKYLR